MAFKTLQNTASQADVQATDIIPIARGSGALSHVLISALVTFLQTALASASGFLKASNDLSDLVDAPTARANLGVQPTAAPSFTGGVTVAGGLGQTGGTIQNVDAMAALNIDFSAADGHTKTISSNSTFTFSGFAAAKMQASVLDLTITSAAVPAWPAGVKWSGGSAPALGNGRHLLGFFTDDGGVTVVGLLGATNVS